MIKRKMTLNALNTVATLFIAQCAMYEHKKLCSDEECDVHKDYALMEKLIKRVDDEEEGF